MRARIQSPKFQLALQFYLKGDYSQALEIFSQLMERSQRSSDPSFKTECAIYLIRLLAEQERFEEIAAVESSLVALMRSVQSGETASRSSSLRSSAIIASPQVECRLYYVLGIARVYRSAPPEESLSYFHKAMERAMGADDRSLLAWPLYGAATVLYSVGRHADSLSELEKLDALLSCYPTPELAVSSSLLKSLIARNQRKDSEALKYAWSAFDQLKLEPNLVLYLHTLTAIGSIYLQTADYPKAFLYLDLAHRSLKRTEFPRIARLVDDYMKDLKAAQRPDFDLRFDEENDVLYEASRGEVRFEGQFVLRDLLKLFLSTPGQPIAKAEIVQKVWGESYRPQVHDNKIYVNIKRLRKLIEAEDGSTEYLKRAKDGYFLNPNAKLIYLKKEGQK